MIKFTLETGLRRQELADLTWDSVKYQKRFIQVSKTKTGYPRRIPLTSKIKEILSTVSPNPSSHYNIPDSAPLFTNSVESIECAFKRAKKRAGVNFTLHMLRHEAISRLFEQGLSPIEVASISGHRTLSQLMRYSHADTQNLLEKMEGNLS